MPHLPCSKRARCQCTALAGVVGVFWFIASALLAVSLPLLLLQPELYVDLGVLSRAKSELVVLPGICCAMGLVNSAIRLVMLAGPRALRSSAS